MYTARFDPLILTICLQLQRGPLTVDQVLKPFTTGSYCFQVWLEEREDVDLVGIGAAFCRCSFWNLPFRLVFVQLGLVAASLSALPELPSGIQAGEGAGNF